MTISRTTQIISTALALALLLATLGAAGQAPGSAPTKIEVTDVPPQDCGGPTKQSSIAGKVTGPVAADQRIVIYAAACNGVLYVQPTVAAPFTSLADNK